GSPALSMNQTLQQDGGASIFPGFRDGSGSKMGRHHRECGRAQAALKATDESPGRRVATTSDNRTYAITVEVPDHPRSSLIKVMTATARRVRLAPGIAD